MVLGWVFFVFVGIFLVVSCMAHGVVGWKKARQRRHVREGSKSDTGQEAVCICQCLFQFPHPLSHAQPWAGPGWAQAVQQLCPAPRHCWGCAGPALVEVPWCSRHSPSVPPGTVGPSWPKTAGRSIVPRWPLQVPVVSELLAGQVGHVPQTLVGRGDAGLTLGWWLLQEMPRVVFSTATLPVAASWASVVSVSPQESLFPQAGPMPQEPCPAVALGAPAPRTSPQSLGHPGGSRGGA